MAETIPLGYNLPNLFPNKDSNEDLCSFLGIPPLQWFSFPLRYAKNVVFWFYSKFILSSKCHPNPSVFSTCVIHTENLQKIEHVACFFFQNGSCDENRSLWRKWSFFSLAKVFEDMIVRLIKLNKNMRPSCSCNISAASRLTHKATQSKVQILHPSEGHLYVCIMHSSISKHSYFLRSYLAFCWEKQSIILSWFLLGEESK